MISSYALDAIFTPYTQNFHTVTFDTFGGRTTVWRTHFDPIMLYISFLSRARRACRGPFCLSEDSEVIIEQLELGALREPTLARLCFVIDFPEFLQREKSTSKVKKKKVSAGGMGHTHHDQ
jgi:hypothetical protein